METYFHRRILRLLLAVTSLLLLPLLATLFTHDVDWNLGDFVIAGILLFGTGLTYELVVWKTPNITYRVAIGLALATALFLVWANLAVGLIGSEDEPANIMYLGVLAVGIIGTTLARLRPRGMAWALFATAFAQAVVAGIALAVGLDEIPGSSVLEIVNVNGFFIMLFVESGLLFYFASAPTQEAETKAITCDRVPPQAVGYTIQLQEKRDYMMTSHIVNWGFGIAFLAIGVLNAILIHPVPGVFYLLLSIVYFPLTNVVLQNKLNFSIPVSAKIILGMAVMWATLAVGELAEMFGL